jgi:shikimate dehydrogenase
MTRGPDRYAVIGQPVAHSRSPWIHAQFARQTGEHLTYSALEIAPAELPQRLREFFAEGGQGLNVTVPHKQAVVPLLDELSEAARIAGAVNVISRTRAGRLRGDNTDGSGFVRDLVRNLGVTVTGLRVLLLGAGGAARGLLAPLLALAPAELAIANRSRDRALQLARDFAGRGMLRGCGFDELGSTPFELIINATAAGLAQQLPPLPLAVLESAAVCYDLVYAGGDTPFVRWAREHGVARCADGTGMLVEQAADSFEIWRGIRPETAAVLAAISA